MKIHCILGPRTPYRAARAAFRAIMAPVLVEGTQLVTLPHLGPQTWAIELAVAQQAQVHLWHGAGFRTLCWHYIRACDVAERVMSFNRAPVAHGKKKYDPERVQQEMLAWLGEQKAKGHEVLVHGFDASEFPPGLERVAWTWDAAAGEYKTT